MDAKGQAHACWCPVAAVAACTLASLAVENDGINRDKTVGRDVCTLRRNFRDKRWHGLALVLVYRVGVDVKNAVLAC